MQNFLTGLAGLVIVLTLLQAFAGTALAQRAGKLRKTLGWAAVVGGAILLARGSVGGAVGLLGFGAFALMQRGGGFGGLGLPWFLMSLAIKGERHLTPHLDVMADKTTGRLKGTVIAGFFKGRRVEAMKPVELAHLWADSQISDRVSADLIAAHLDQVYPRWRADVAGSNNADAGAVLAPTGMTSAQARDILGVATDASPAEIRKAHKDLMLKLHPDLGGSHTLATTVNAAKDLLLQNVKS